jgi:hypothetical protein
VPEIEVVTLELTLDEAEMAHRIICTGVIGGQPSVRSSLYQKVQMAKERAQLGRSYVSTREMIKLGQKEKA